MKYREYREIKIHGSSEFPFEYYLVDKNHPHYVMPLHWHREYEIIRVIGGSFTVHLNGKRFDLYTGDALFVEGGCLKSGYPTDCEYECLVFDVGILGAGGARHTDKLFYVLGASDTRYKNFIPSDNKKLSATVAELLATVRCEGDFFEIKTVGLLYTLIYELYTMGFIYKSGECGGDKIRRMVIGVMRWIDEHITERITLADISSAVGFCEKYICRIFKEYTSKTVMDYVNMRRIEIASAEMITKSITEAAFNSGFNDLSYFCKTFKKYKGVTPSEYKKLGAV